MSPSSCRAPQNDAVKSPRRMFVRSLAAHYLLDILSRLSHPSHARVSSSSACRRMAVLTGRLSMPLRPTGIHQRASSTRTISESGNSLGKPDRSSIVWDETGRAVQFDVQMIDASKCVGILNAYLSLVFRARRNCVSARDFYGETIVDGQIAVACQASDASRRHYFVRGRDRRGMVRPSRQRQCAVHASRVEIETRFVVPNVRGLRRCRASASDGISECAK